MQHFRLWLGFILPALYPAVGIALPSDQTAFRNDMAQRLVKALGGAKVDAVDGDWQQLKVDREGEDHDLTINLGRVWSYCEQASAEDCETVKSAFIDKSIVEPPIAKREDLRIIVRDSQYVEYMRSLRADSKPMAWPVHQIGDDLFAILAVDGPETIALADGKTLSKLGLSESDAWALAKRQTIARLPMLPTPETLAKQPVAFQDGAYLGSLLIQREAFRKIGDAVGPDLIVTVVSDSFVFVARMPDGPGLEKFAASVREDCKAQERCISPHAYRFRDGQWRIAEKGTNQAVPHASESAPASPVPNT